MYEPLAALAAIDTNTTPIFIALLIVVIAVFIYWIAAWRVAQRDQVYVVPFIGIAVFFWHDLSFVLEYDKWFNVYDHWWVKMWWYALAASVVFEALYIYHVIKWGRKDFFHAFSQTRFTALVLLATAGIGAIWFLFKTVMQDELFFITFAITAVWSVPLHTGLMARRQSRKGQSAVMELSTIPMILALSYAFSHVSDFFSSTVYLTFVAVTVAWALMNVWLMYQLPAERTQDEPQLGNSVGQIA
ncbi:hypothetical protein HBA55_04735 [Pseudomaricurvus alkylphenolicus]|uniref:hypothetical protein n=1 Tax=Pseudomaricurvus alkylphenolicus TaxID=1306991 RepID=UPI00141EBB1D|nr:hypothetical protein [Pseudomaricurvus alkylphenolicus]NIB38879.1 hypothetical protein [Pseudomaricurvus alkylphenolicus]